jgi:hypothetical protein
VSEKYGTSFVYVFYTTESVGTQDFGSLPNGTSSQAMGMDRQMEWEGQ